MKNYPDDMLSLFHLEKIIILFSVVLLTDIVVVLLGSNNPRVKTSIGVIEGFKYENKDGSISNIFLGIPYAQAPVGNLRFEKPVRYSGLQRILKANKFAPACFPVHRASFSKHSEDCLFLNIITPAKKSKSANGYPVVVFIHGGGFVFGGTEELGYKSFSEHFASYGIIAVTIQYRVGSLGFFTTGDTILPGNNGLWDQMQALRFLHEILPDFGGNPLEITLWGNSAGAASVHALSLSPHSKSLFSRGIQSSGSLFAHWAVNKGVLSNSLKLTQILKCSGKNSTTVRDCMKKKTINEILDAGTEIEGLAVREFSFNPWVDGDFFPQPLKNETNENLNIPILFGLTEKEDTSVVRHLKCPQQISKLTNGSEVKECSKRELQRFIKDIIVPETCNSTSTLKDFIYQHFTTQNPINKEENVKEWLMNTVVDIWSDLNFVLPLVMQIRQRTKLNQTSYLFYQKYYHAMPALLVQGAAHVNENSYFFDVESKYAFFNLTDKDKIFQRNLLEGFRSFILTGTPYCNGIEWPNVSADNGRHIVLTPDVHVEETFERERVEFWTCELPQKVPMDILMKTQLLYTEMHKATK